MVNPHHIECYNYLSSRIAVATIYYDKELLVQLELLDDIRWLFTRDEMGQLIEMKDHTYQDLILKFLSTLHVEVVKGPQCQEGISHFTYKVNFMS